MGIDDWTLITDGTTTKSLVISQMTGAYSLKLHADEANSTNYVTYLYNAANTNLVNTKTETLMIARNDYLNTAAYWIPVAFNTGSTDSTYSASDNSITKTGGTNGSWSNSVYDSVHFVTRVGFGIKFKIKNIAQWNGGAFIGIHSSAASVAYSSLSEAIIIYANANAGVNGYSAQVYENNVVRLGTNAVDAWNVSLDDIFSIEINANSKFEFRINGILMYLSTVTWTSAYKYVHALMLNLGDSMYVWEDNPANSNIFRSANPIIFNRLQGTNLTSSCYALEFGTNNTNNLTLLKGNLNSATPTILTISSNAVSPGYPYMISFETTTTDSSAVKCVASTKAVSTIANTGAGSANYAVVNAGVVALAPGKWGNALSLENSGLYVYNTNATMGLKTVETWIYPRDVSRGQILKRYYNPTYPLSDMFIQFRNGKLIGGITQYYNLAYYPFYIPSVSTLSVNTWYHVVITYTNVSPYQCNFYINGVLQGTATYTSTYTGSGSYASNFIVGYSYDSPSGGYAQNFYNGLIEGFQFVYGYVYSQSDVTTRYNAQAGGTEPTLFPTYGTHLFNFNDTYTESKIFEYLDSDSPILTGGRTGVGLHNPAKINSNAYFDDTTIYTG